MNEQHANILLLYYLRSYIPVASSYLDISCESSLVSMTALANQSDITVHVEGHCLLTDISEVRTGNIKYILEVTSILYLDLCQWHTLC